RPSPSRATTSTCSTGNWSCSCTTQETAWPPRKRPQPIRPTSSCAGQRSTLPGNFPYPTVTTSQSSSARQARQALGARLRELRKDANLTGRALADRCGWHYTKVSKLENAAQSPTDDDLRHWCRATGTDDQTEDLIATARAVQSAYLEFRQQSRAGMKRVLGAHTLELYERTRKFRIYEHNVIPGLFQTPDYCAAMLSFWIAFLGTTNDLTDAVPAPLERQRVIYQNGRQLAVILEEQALRTWFGTA